MYVCDKAVFSQILGESVKTLCNLLPQTNTYGSLNACERLNSICVYDNEAEDALVCLTVRGCIIQFIPLMSPAYLAILICCFQGRERSNISGTGLWKASFNEAAPRP